MSIPQSHKKERLSLAYVAAVAAIAGVKLFGRDGNVEYGVDGYFQRLREYRPGKIKESGPQIQYQVKSTCDWGFQDDLVYYDMETEAYDKLVDVVEDDSPTILFLFCMPSEAEIETWLSISEKKLVLKKCCYWDHIKGQATNKAKSTKRIKIARNQLLTPEALNNFFVMLKDGKFQ